MAFDNFTALAFRQGAAVQANRLIDEVRRATKEELGEAVNYEVVLTGRAPGYLRQEVAPRLAFFLRAKRYAASRCRPVFLTLFQGDRVYFVRAPDFFEELRASEGLSEESFDALARSWEATGRAAVAALAAPRTGDGHHEEPAAGDGDGKGDGNGNGKGGDLP